MTLTQTRQEKFNEFCNSTGLMPDSEAREIAEIFGLDCSVILPVRVSELSLWICNKLEMDIPDFLDDDALHRVCCDSLLDILE